MHMYEHVLDVSSTNVNLHVCASLITFLICDHIQIVCTSFIHVYIQCHMEIGVLITAAF